MRVPHLSPTTLTTDEQRLILRATAGNVRDHTIISLALGTGLRLAELVGLNVSDVAATGRIRPGLRAPRLEAHRRAQGAADVSVGHRSNSPGYFLPTTEHRYTSSVSTRVISGLVPAAASSISSSETN